MWVQWTQNRPGHCLVVDAVTLMWILENVKEDLSGVSRILEVTFALRLLLFLPNEFYTRVAEGEPQT